MNENKISGWYYDLQRNNDLTSVKLLANSTVDNKKLVNKFDDGGALIKNSNGTYLFEEEIADGNLYEQGGSWREINKEDKTKYSWWEEDSEGYNKLLCRSILTEDFNLTTTNAWTDFGSDPIGAAWEGIAKPLAPYASIFRKGLNDMVEGQGSANENDGKVVSFAKKATEFVSKIVNNTEIDEYLNKSLVVQGTRFTYYSGTGISFNNLGMRFTIFPKWEPGFDKNGKKTLKFVSVLDQLEDLYPYTIGRFIPFLIKNTTIEKCVKEFLKPIGLGGVEDKIVTRIEDFVKNYVNWQEPPGGYKAINKDIDQIQPGTLKLKIGGLYAITNLVCSDASFTLSKQMVKSPIDDDSQNKNLSVTPLYCDVNLMLKPATKYSERSIRKFVSGSSMAEDKKKISESLKKGLDTAKLDYDV